MKENLLGATATLRLTVEEHMTATLDGVEIHPVYSTFWLAYHAEVVARKALEPYFDEGENAVGSAIALQHKAMTPVGATVDVTACVVRVEGKRVRCSITAKNEGPYHKPVLTRLNGRTIRHIESHADILCVRDSAVRFVMGDATAKRTKNCGF